MGNPQVEDAGQPALPKNINMGGCDYLSTPPNMHN
jgi:hypothetical protein